MTCPYCTNCMKIYKTVAYRAGSGTRLTEWVRCTVCEHKTVVTPEEVIVTPRAAAA